MLPDNREAILDDLRLRMQRILARSVLAPRRHPDASPPLSFESRVGEYGPLYIREKSYSLLHHAGDMPIASARFADRDQLAHFALDPRIAGCDPARALYLDTETTGLSGGAGTLAFLVGIAFFCDKLGAFQLEQLFLSDLAHERAMLEHLAARLREASMIVTFNGKSFDMPLLRSRFVMARMTPPKEPPHLDLLHIARRVHRARNVACRLGAIETNVLGFARVDDVPSSEVSARFWSYMRTRRDDEILGVVEHNAWDVVSMAALVALYGDSLETTRLSVSDLVGVARTLSRAGMTERAIEVATRAYIGGAGAKSLRARAEIFRTIGDRASAMADLEQFCATVDDPNARLELAKLYEHFAKSPKQALELIDRGTSESEEATQKRRARLIRLTSPAGRRSACATS